MNNCFMVSHNWDNVNISVIYLYFKLFDLGMSIFDHVHNR